MIFAAAPRYFLIYEYGIRELREKSIVEYENAVLQNLDW